MNNEIERIWNQSLDYINYPVMMLSEDHEVLRCNKYAREMLGDDIVGSKCYEKMHKSDSPPAECPCKRAKDSIATETMRIEFNGALHRVTCIPVGTKSGHYFIHISHDITEIAESEKQVKSIFNAVNCLMFITDSDMIIKMFNKPASEILSDIKTGISIYDIFDSTTAALMRKNIDDIKNVNDGIEVEYKGRIYDLRIYTMSGFENVQNIIMMEDISERKSREETEKSEMRRLFELQKLESISVLAGGIAHDFNNILMAIIGNAELGMAELPQSSPVRDTFNSIIEASSDAAKINRQILAYSGQGKTRVKSIVVNELIEGIDYLLSVLLPDNIVLKYKLKEDIDNIKGDPNQIKQIIVNLVSNAIDAIEDKRGVITIKTGSMYCDRAYLENTFVSENVPEGRDIYIEVSDTGTGVDKELKTRIFEPYFTTKEHGRGLGMSAILGIVRSNGGALKIYSEKGEGTTVKVLLPVESPQDGKFADTVKWQGKGKILIVDDDEKILEIACLMLKSIGFETITASDGVEAIDIMKDNDDINLVILDLTMPGMNGNDTYSAIRRISGDIPVIITSGYDARRIEEEFAGKNIAGIIEKPYRMETLRDIIRSITDPIEKD
ncbi:MAG: response regulator [candidate division WOR-3 bacterium]|nr:response regulator [candidate division WOR-3 bacterium]